MTTAVSLLQGYFLYYLNVIQGYLYSKVYPKSCAMVFQLWELVNLCVVSYLPVSIGSIGNNWYKKH